MPGNKIMLECKQCKPPVQFGVRQMPGKKIMLECKLPVKFGVR